MLGNVPYSVSQQAMHRFTDTRTPQTPDEVWLLEHDAVFTQGQAGKAEHLLYSSDIPVIQSDRGGQITYHGRGQLIVYFLIDLKRKKLSVRELVSTIENLAIDLLATFGISATSKPNAPGIYVAERKIGSLGLRIRHGCTFHGLALNIDMDLAPFAQINPCGYAGLKMTQLSELYGDVSVDEVIPTLIECIAQRFNYSSHLLITGNEKYDKT